MTCSHSADCPLFAQFAMEPALDVWKQHYCEGDYSKCARYQLSLKGEAIPLTLMPNGKMIEQKVKSKEELAGTALFNAILKGRASMVKSMFATNVASAEIRTADGSTPLMAAASVGNLEIVNLLLEFGCNPFNTNKAGLNALKVAESKNFTDCADAIRNFMLEHKDLKAKAIKANKEEPETEQGQQAEKEEMKGIVSMLKKLNPFSR